MIFILKIKRYKISKMEQKNAQQWVDKYRPNKLEHIISHEHILKIIKNMIEDNCLSHLLFNGQRGVGKTTLIQTIVNEFYGNEQKFMILKLNASNHRGIDIVRNEIKSFVTSRMMFSTKPKLVILDEADAMTIDAQLALRRIMDKYSNNAKFCIICNYIRKIHPSIISRCLQFKFKSLKHQSMKERLNYINNKENLEITDDTMNKIISISNNDMRQSIFLLQALSFEKEKSSDKLCEIFKYPTNTQIKEFIDILQLPLQDKIDNLLFLINNYGYHLSILIEIYFDYCLKYNLFDEIYKLANLQYNINGEYSNKLQIYALMSIFNLPS